MTTIPTVRGQWARLRSLYPELDLRDAASAWLLLLLLRAALAVGDWSAERLSRLPGAPPFEAD